MGPCARRDDLVGRAQIEHGIGSNSRAVGRGDRPLGNVVNWLIAAGQWKRGDPHIVIVADTGYDITRPAHVLGVARRNPCASSTGRQLCPVGSTLVIACGRGDGLSQGKRVGRRREVGQSPSDRVGVAIERGVVQVVYSVARAVVAAVVGLAGLAPPFLRLSP